MQKTTLAELAKMAKAAKGSIDRLYIHWTAGHYDSVFDDYHINITGAGETYLSTDDLTAVLAHTWHRNTGAIGIALCCCVDATINCDGTFSFGSEPPTDLQIEKTAQVIAVLADVLGLPIDAEHVMTHAEVGDLDGYGPAEIGTKDFEKWDLWQLIDYDGEWRGGGEVLRGKANWYLCGPGATMKTEIPRPLSSE
ncbi:MAG: N-acetylmuramoyl-L-alanine amidase [Clostridia bacterium]|nr:N-acetylmuramoyl-L-alanine amidase [Clostridia bacterium]